MVASLVAEHGLWGTWASLLHGLWGLPGLGIASVPSALAGRLSTTRPPGKSMLLQEKKKTKTVILTLPKN